MFSLWISVIWSLCSSKKIGLTFYMQSFVEKNKIVHLDSFHSLQVVWLVHCILKIIFAYISVVAEGEQSYFCCAKHFPFYFFYLMIKFIPCLKKKCLFLFWRFCSYIIWNLKLNIKYRYSFESIERASNLLLLEDSKWKGIGPGLNYKVNRAYNFDIAQHLHSLSFLFIRPITRISHKIS